MPMLPTGLVRDPDSGVYYLRRRIPSNLLSEYPPKKKEEVFSLKTKDYRTAMERFRSEDVKLSAKWDKMRKRLELLAKRWKLRTVQHVDTLTPEVIDTICTHFEAASLTVDERRRDQEAYILPLMACRAVGCPAPLRARALRVPPGAVLRR